MCRLWSSFDWNQLSSLQKKLTRPAGDDLVNGLLLKTIRSKRGGGCVGVVGLTVIPLGEHRSAGLEQELMKKAIGYNRRSIRTPSPRPCRSTSLESYII